MNTYIVYAKRSAIGRFGGALAEVRIDDLLAALIKNLFEHFSFDPLLIDDVIIGCANQAGEDNRNLARMSALLAGLPYEVPATTINRLCGSSLDAIMDAHGRIQAGFGHCFIVGGAESMSRAPYVLSKSNHAFGRSQQLYDTTIGWRFPNPLMKELFPLLGMGETAEEVAKELKISREDQDQFAYDSHYKAVQAINSGAFVEEIIPYSIKTKKGELIFDTDEGPRADCSLEKLASLKPAFNKDGSVTAGNSSSINDGASLCLLVSETFLKENKLTPMVQITGAAVRGRHPNTMGLGPIDAINRLCQQFHFKISDFDIIELNEAFAAQSLGCIRQLQLNPEIVNIRGGAIALGHPLGCSGTRLLTTMIHTMKDHPQRRKGIATMCIGVGQGIAVSVESCF